MILCIEVTPQTWPNWDSNVSKRLFFLSRFSLGRTNLQDCVSFQMPFREYHKKLEFRVQVNDNIHYLHHNIKYLCCNTVSCKVVHPYSFCIYFIYFSTERDLQCGFFLRRNSTHPPSLGLGSRQNK